MKTQSLIANSRTRRMRKTFQFCLFLFVGLFVTSCADVEFNKPMPQNGKVLKTFPKSLQGTYSSLLMSGEKKLVIGKDYIISKKIRQPLSKSLILVKSHGMYVLNIKGDKFGQEKPRWKSYIIEEAGCGFLRASALAIPNESSKSKENTKKLNLFKSTYSPQIDSNKRYLLSISDKQFWQLMTDTNFVVKLVLDKVK